LPAGSFGFDTVECSQWVMNQGAACCATRGTCLLKGFNRRDIVFSIVGIQAVRINNDENAKF
jgi:hypothetical protein